MTAGENKRHAISSWPFLFFASGTDCRREWGRVPCPIGWQGELSIEDSAAKQMADQGVCLVVLHERCPVAVPVTVLVLVPPSHAGKPQ